MAGLVGIQRKGKEKPHGQEDSLIIHVIHIDQGLHVSGGSGALPMELSQRETLVPYPT
jgi:hypothetical protein